MHRFHVTFLGLPWYRFGCITSYMRFVFSRSVFLFHRDTVHTKNLKFLSTKERVDMSTVLPQVVSREELPASEAKWVTLEKIKYRDQDGKEVREDG